MEYMLQLKQVRIELKRLYTVQLHKVMVVFLLRLAIIFRGISADHFLISFELGLLRTADI